MQSADRLGGSIAERLLVAAIHQVPYMDSTSFASNPVFG
jgi:hypothetical protein